MSAPSELLDAADKQVQVCMFTNFSEYIRDLIRRDLRKGGDRTDLPPQSPLAPSPG